jgi:hypothetical protein
MGPTGARFRDRPGGGAIAPDPVAKRATRLRSNDPLLVDFLALIRGRLGPASRVQGYNAVSLNAAILLCYLFKTDAWPPDRWVAHSLRDLAELNHLTYDGTPQGDRASPALEVSQTLPARTDPGRAVSRLSLPPLHRPLHRPDLGSPVRGGR